MDIGWALNLMQTVLGVKVTLIVLVVLAVGWKIRLDTLPKLERIDSNYSAINNKLAEVLGSISKIQEALKLREYQHESLKEDFEEQRKKIEQIEKKIEEIIPLVHVMRGAFSFFGSNLEKDKKIESKIWCEQSPDRRVDNTPYNGIDRRGKK